MKVFFGVCTLLLFVLSTPHASVNNITDLLGSTTIDIENKQNREFVGLWVNGGGQTKMITRCKISSRKGNLVVQMWGECSPEDCDWGETVASEVEKGATKFELLWNNVSFAESAVTYELIDGKLKMTHTRRYKDNSGREDKTFVEYFNKQ